MRARAGSIGSMTSRNRIHRSNECELKVQLTKYCHRDFMIYYSYYFIESENI